MLALIAQQFFRWYNHDHRHGGIGWMAPAAVHDGTAAALTAHRAVTLDAAFAAHPIRFKGRAPKPPVLANRRLDQPTDKRVLNGRAHTNLMTPGVPKSLTRSVGCGSAGSSATSVPAVTSLPS